MVLNHSPDPSISCNFCLFLRKNRQRGEGEGLSLRDPLSSHFRDGSKVGRGCRDWSGLLRYPYLTSSQVVKDFLGRDRSKFHDPVPSFRCVRRSTVLLYESTLDLSPRLRSGRSRYPSPTQVLGSRWCTFLRSSGMLGYFPDYHLLLQYDHFLRSVFSGPSHTEVIYFTGLVRSGVPVFRPSIDGSHHQCPLPISHVPKKPPVLLQDFN